MSVLKKLFDTKSIFVNTRFAQKYLGKTGLSISTFLSQRVNNYVDPRTERVYRFTDDDLEAIAKGLEAFAKELVEDAVEVRKLKSNNNN